MAGGTEREDEEARYFSAGTDRTRRRLDRLLDASIQSAFALLPPIWVAADASVRAAARMMAAGDVGAVLVRGDGGKLVGILSERDVLRGITVGGADAEHTRVDACMSPVPAAIRTTECVAEAFHVLGGGRGVRYLPVADAKRHIVGCLSVRDLAAYLVDCLPEHLANLPPSGLRAAPVAAEGA